MSMFRWRGLLRLVFVALCVSTALLWVGTLAAKLAPCTRPPLPNRYELFDAHLAGVDTIDEAIARIERTRPVNPAAFADARAAFCWSPPRRGGGLPSCEAQPCWG